MGKNMFLIIGLLFIYIQAQSQWFTIDEFNKWENYLKQKYGFIPDSAIKRAFVNPKEKMLEFNLSKQQNYNNFFHKGIELLNYPQPTQEDLRRIPWSNDTTPIHEQKRLEKYNKQVFFKKENYYEAKSKATYYLTEYWYNYPKLKEYNDFIIYMVTKSLYYDNNWRRHNTQVKLLSLLNINPSLRDSLLAIPNLDDVVRAKLGDTISENKVIDRFCQSFKDTILDRREIEFYVNNIFYLNTDKAITAFCKALEKSHNLCIVDFEGEEWICYLQYSLAEILTDCYNDYFENDLIYFREYIYKHPKFKGDNSAFNIRSIFYFQTISQYLSEKFNRNVVINAKYRNRQFCVKK
jgi:hypothetical protein